MAINSAEILKHDSFQLVIFQTLDYFVLSVTTARQTHPVVIKETSWI